LACSAIKGGKLCFEDTDTTIIQNPDTRTQLNMQISSERMNI